VAYMFMQNMLCPNPIHEKLLSKNPSPRNT